MSLTESHRGQVLPSAPSSKRQDLTPMFCKLGKCDRKPARLLDIRSGFQYLFPLNS
jgi:hypothetical protein